MLEAALLGQFAVHVGSSPARIGSRPAQTLLAYLLLTAGTRHRREKLAALLWPDADDDHARQNLRNALWKLNKALGSGYVVADKLTVSFDASSSYRLDAAELEASGDGSIEALSRSVASYGGELLPGFYEEWILLERDRMHGVFERKAQALIEALAAASRWPDVLEWAEKWISLGQAAEPAYRGLMLARHALGDAAGVASAYRRCREDLEEQLGIEPSEETTALYRQYSRREAQQTRRERIPASPARPGPAVPGFLAAAAGARRQRRAPFIGREAELARLAASVERSLAGRTQVMLVTGEAGQGKTSLLAEFCRRTIDAHPESAVALGSCDAFAGAGDPFLPFRDIIAMLTGDAEPQWRAGTITTKHAMRLWSLIPDAIEALIGDGSDLLDTLLPSGPLLHRAAAYARAGRLETLEASIGEAIVDVRARGPDRSRLFDAYTDVLEAIAMHHPLVLIVDDLHWADSSSIHLFFHLGRRLAGRAIVLVGSYRPEATVDGPLGVPHPLQEVTAELERLHGDIRLDLDEAAGAQRAARDFVDGLLDRDPNTLDEGFRLELVRRTGGHPLFTVELLHHLEEHGGLVRDEAGRWRASTALDWDAVPARVDGVIRARLGRVDGTLRDALAAASVEGEEFTAEVVARVQGVDPRHLVTQLGRVADRQHRLVRDQGVHQVGGLRLSRFRFRHSLFQRHLYDSLAASERTYLHESVARALEACYGDAADTVAAQLARHYRDAGRHGEAVGYYLAAGRRALMLAATEEAIGHLRHGLELLDAAPDAARDPHEELQLLLALGAALQALHGFAAEEVGDVFRRAHDLGVRVGTPIEQVQASWNLWAYHMQHARLATAREIARDVLALARLAADDGLLLQALHALWFTTLCQGEFAAARAHAEEGIAIYDTARHHAHAHAFGGHDPGVCARLFAARALWHLGEADAARERAAEALTLAHRLGHPNTLVHAHVFASEVDVLRGEARDALDTASAAHQMANDLGLGHWSAWSTILRGCALVELGDLSAGIELLETGIEAYRAIGGELEVPVFLGRLAEAYMKRDDVDAAIGAVSAALATAERTGERRHDADLHRIRSELLERRGQAAAATAALQEALACARAQGAVAFERVIEARLGRERHAETPTPAST